MRLFLIVIACVSSAFAATLSDFDEGSFYIRFIKPFPAHLEVAGFKITIEGADGALFHDVPSPQWILAISFQESGALDMRCRARNISGALKNSEALGSMFTLHQKLPIDVGSDLKPAMTIHGIIHLYDRRKGVVTDVKFIESDVQFISKQG